MLLSSWSQSGLQIKKLLPPQVGLMDFQGRVQTSLAGGMGAARAQWRGMAPRLARQTLASLQLLQFA